MQATQIMASNILLIEDNSTDAKMITLCLDKLSIPLQVEHIVTTDEALCHIEECGQANRRQLPDLILLDLNLPGHGGHKILQQIRATPEFGSTPVIILSTSSYEADLLACYDAGANSYIVKPSDFRTLRTVIEHTVTYWLSADQNGTQNNDAPGCLVYAYPPK